MLEKVLINMLLKVLIEIKKMKFEINRCKQEMKIKIINVINIKVKTKMKSIIIIKIKIK